ncbi:ABC transporter ATP-binding protein [Gluconacetobacter azotocaptans]|uniref:ABC transporter ATP-binding protein n=1 Tax=Gluconacetobacter azotocaptans TaxID=142834 RepID=UPI002156E54E|nr:ATP-binding cassette domain-containing protein [Gluconacetobacter azotocaptans]GBQ35243.1 ferrichrome ABC transporter ATP-binding protein [Gluconacetobacter azotocaptans DSM 13594]
MSDRTHSRPLCPAGLSLRGLRNSHAGPFDVDVPRGRCLVVTGMSGAGKSVLLRMIADLDPHQGGVALDGVACADMPAHQWRRQVLYLPAEPGWWSDIVLDHMPDAAETRGLLVQVGLREGVLRTPVHRLSTGERQRLALVRALLLQPGVLLLDEPCSALDEATTRKVEALLGDRKAKGMAIVLVSHDQAQADRMADLRRHMMSGHFTGDAA